MMADDCLPIATLQSFQGKIESRAAGTQQWVEATLGQTFCQGASLKSSGKSRAAVRLANDTLVRLDQKTTITFTDIQTNKKSLLDVLKGVIHMMSRTPRPLEVRTPFVNAAIEGTEFVISAALDHSNITVYEGQVRATNKLGELLIKANQSGHIETNLAPEVLPVTRPRDAVAWTLYYPPLIDDQTFDVSQYATPKLLAEALNASRNGHPLQAFAVLNSIEDNARDSGFHLISAAINLNQGDIFATQKHLKLVDELSPDCSYAASLRAIIAVTQNKLDLAEKHITHALNHFTDNPIPHIASSYVEQARFHIPEALAAAQKAADLAPGSARIQARLASVALMSNMNRKAHTGAHRAVELNPSLSQIHTLLGFTSLKNLHINDAKSAFDQAIELNSGEPLSWLGLGLVNMRHNKLKLGRENIELATLLNPSNALMRSYLGKAYYEEIRPERSAMQYELAKNLDPNDPTAWFYHSILSQSINRPIAALKDQTQAIKLNGYRGVYRSRQLLDQDEAARTVSLGRIYTDLGFEPLAISQATSALAIDPGNHSAHRLLADSYRRQDETDAARLSEVLQAQMLQPLNLMPMQPQLTNSNLGLLDSAGPGSLSYNEYNPMFIRQGVFTQFNLTTGSQGTWGNDAVIAGLGERAAYSLGQYHFETEGDGNNNNFKKDIYNVFAQGRLTQSTSAQFELKREEETKGDVAFKFFPSLFNDPDIQVDREITTYRAGLTQEVSHQSKWLLSLSWKDRQSTSVNPQNFALSPSVSVPAEILIDNKTNIGLFDFQYLHINEKFSLISGASHNQEHGSNTLRSNFLTIPCPFPSCDFPTADPDDSQTKLYSYLNYKLNPRLKVLTGITLAKESSPQLNEHYVLPKLGVDWKKSDRLHLRMAAFRSLQSNMTASFYQTLEPTQITSFNQFLDEPNHSRAWNYGLDLEGSLGAGVSWGIRSIYRDGEIPLVVRDFSLANPTSQVQSIETTRHWTNLYLTWAVNANLAMSAGYSSNRFVLSQPLTTAAEASGFAPDGIERLKTQTLPLMARYFHPSGFGLEATATYFDQQGDFILNQPGSVSRHGTDQFWLANLTASYRLRHRRGSLSVGINNLFDQSFQFEDIASNDAFAPFRTAAPSDLNHERFLFGKITFNFR